MAKSEKKTKDELAGYRDRIAGCYDKWYRYNREDDGAEYDKGCVRAVRSGKCPGHFNLIESGSIEVKARTEAFHKVGKAIIDSHLEGKLEMDFESYWNGVIDGLLEHDVIVLGEHCDLHELIDERI